MSSSRMRAFLTLLRPANWWSSAADVAAGLALLYKPLHRWPEPRSLLLLGGSSMLLYGGGVVFNDLFDAPLDRIERPERPIACGQIRPTEALAAGLSCYLLAGILAGLQGPLSLWLAGLIVAASLLYNGWAKAHPVWGPLVMGSCRALNLLLGLSAPGRIHPWMVLLSLVPLGYIAAVTHISRGEVHGSDTRPMQLASVICLLAAGAVLAWSLHGQHFWQTLGFVLLFLAAVLPSLLRAWRTPSARNIGRAVKFGVLGIIVLDTAWTAAAGPLAWALGLLLLWPLSLALSRLFAIT